MQSFERDNSIYTMRRNQKTILSILCILFIPSKKGESP